MALSLGDGGAVSLRRGLSQAGSLTDMSYTDGDSFTQSQGYSEDIRRNGKGIRETLKSDCQIPSVCSGHCVTKGSGEVVWR